MITSRVFSTSGILYLISPKISDKTCNVFGILWRTTFESQEPEWNSANRKQFKYVFSNFRIFIFFQKSIFFFVEWNKYFVGNFWKNNEKNQRKIRFFLWMLQVLGSFRFKVRYRSELPVLRSQNAYNRLRWVYGHSFDKISW